MGRKMKSAPVYFTVAQARFNQILTLDSYAPQIQEKLRKEGFPDAQKGFLTTLNLNFPKAAEDSPPQVPVDQTVRYLFGNMERTSGFILDQGALSYQTTNYDTFESFSTNFLIGLRAVEDAVKLNFTDRVGLRYLDAVFPKSGETLQDYLEKSMLGLSEKLGGIVVQAFSESLVKSGDINVRSRVIIQDEEVGFPPDLQPLGLTLQERFSRLKGHHAILDTDGWSESRRVFSLEEVSMQLNGIHTEIDKTFRAIVTENALKVWEGEP